MLKAGSATRRNVERASGRTFPSVGEIAELLRPAYPNSNLGNKSNPLDEVAYIVLAGQTDYDLAQKSYSRFKHRFPRWEEVADARVRTIARVIRIGGLGHQKAHYLKQIAFRLRADFGSVSLRWIRKMPTDEAETYLGTLPGVGVKTARCVLLYSLSRPVFPADVHCLRIMTRLGWLHWNRQRAESLADTAQDGVPPRLRRLLHIRLVQHGRAVCKARPECSVCVLSHCCPSAGKAR